MPKSRSSRRKERVRSEGTAPIDSTGIPDFDERNTVVMFVDVMGASEVSNYKSPSEYAAFVNGYQAMFESVCKEYIGTWYPEKSERDSVQFEARGDEGLLMIYPPEGATRLPEDVDIAVNIALELKRRWLYSDENRKRIQSGLLPINLGIGIHVGKTYLESTVKTTNNPGGLKPEGYAINLGKRVESFSRHGRYTDIFLSESAHGYLTAMADEQTYLFDLPQVFNPKGISRDIRVFEVKHHFLPTDWRDLSETASRAKSLLDPTKVDEQLAKEAVSINPANLWLVEEYIRANLLRAYDRLTEADRNDNDRLREAFEPARERAALLAQSAQRDAGVLFIQGLIEGECGRYSSERKMYEAAIQDTDQLAEAYWYKGLSFSFEVLDSVEDPPSLETADLSPELQELVCQAKDSYNSARIRRPQSAWILFDLACEMIQWPKELQETEQGLRLITQAITLLPSIKEVAKNEPYLQKVRSMTRFKAMIS